jgi:surface antigen
VSSPLKVVNIASSVRGVSKKIATIRIVAIAVVIFLGFLAAGSAASYIQGNLAPLLGKIGTVCSVDSSQKINSQTGADNFTSPDQQQNAQLIINEVARRNLPERAAVIALATAMQESSLVNVNYGDDLQGVRNPDGTLTTSRGLFQQQDPWGPLSVRLDPTGTTGLFLDRLVRVPNWQILPLTVVAQTVQRSGLPDAYAKWETRATEIVNQKPPTEGSYGTSTGLTPTSPSGTSGSTALCENGGAVGIGTASGKGDDYPEDLKNAAPDSVVDPWQFYNRECVSFVAWRINVQMGWKPGEPWKFSAATLDMTGNGNANNWGIYAARKGYKVDSNPAPGAVAWWGGAVNNGIITGPIGHVAIVSKVNDNGTIDIEQYNADPPYAYSTMTIPTGSATGYIHLADIP